MLTFNQYGATKVQRFSGVLPISFIKNDNAYNVTIADKVMVICCALVKICEPNVPKDYVDKTMNLVVLS